MNNREIENKVLSSIDSKLLLKHAKYISSFDRESGSKGEKKAAEYFEKVMNEYGLDVEVKYIENLISLPISAQITLDDGRNLSCLTHSYASSTKPGGLVANAVFYPDSTNVKDKIAIVKGLASPTICFELERKGACGIICISSCDYPYNMAISPIWGMPVPETIGLLGTIPVVTVNETDGETILKYILDETKEIKIKSLVETKFRQVPICIADLKGNTLSDRYVLFNGHIDSWHKGAVDNATGNSAILEIARILNDFKDELKVNVRFIWWSGHSNGRYSGSNWYADYNWQDIHENAVVNVNIDAIGAKGATSYRHIESSAQCYNVAFEVIKELTDQEPKYARIQRNGDQSFWGHGVPSLFEILSLQPETNQGKGTFVPGLPWYWHTIKDEFEHVGEKELKMDTMIYLASIWRFITKPVLPFSFNNLGNEILTNLNKWKNVAGEAFDLSSLIDQASILSNMFKNLDNEISKLNNIEVLSEKEQADATLLNDYIMELNRILIPVHYCKKSPFNVDLALPVKPFPGLTELEKLSKMDHGSFEFKILERQLIRERNRIFYYLKEAINLINKLKKRHII